MTIDFSPVRMLMRLIDVNFTQPEFRSHLRLKSGGTKQLSKWKL